MGGGKGGGSSGPKKLSTRCDSSLNTIKTPGTIQYSSTERPVGVAFHNGRVFYFGLDIFGQPAVYFSQLLTDTSKAGLCYQDADPTAEEINDLVATDGGVLRPVGMGTPIAAMESDFGVLCFCSNGVWIIRGPEGSGFTATNFNVGKVTDKGCLGKQSIVDVSGAIIYFHEDAIIQLAPDEFGRIQATDLTNDSIKSLYLGFTSRDRSNAKGCYIESEKRAYWVIPTGQANGTYKHDARNVLVLATDLPGFYQWTLPTTTANNVLLLPFEDKTKTEVVALETLTTTDGITAVTLVDGSTLVTSEVRFVEEGDTLPLFMTSRQESTTFPVEIHHPTSNSFSDFGSQDYTSFVEFGYQYGSSKAAGLSAPYIHSFFKRGRGETLASFWGRVLPDVVIDVCPEEGVVPFAVAKLADATVPGTFWDGLAADYTTGGFAYNLDGTLAFIVVNEGTGNYDNRIYEFALAEPFLFSTGVATDKSLNLNSGLASGIGGIRDPKKIWFSPDGTILIVGISDNFHPTSLEIFTYDLSVPWNITSAVERPSSYSPLVGTENDASFELSPDGTRIWYMHPYTFSGGGLVAGRIEERVLAIPYDVSSDTGTPIKTSDILNGFLSGDEWTSFAFTNDGFRLLATHGPLVDVLFEVLLSTPYDISTAYSGRLFATLNAGTIFIGTLGQIPNSGCYIPITSHLGATALLGSLADAYNTTMTLQTSLPSGAQDEELVPAIGFPLPSIGDYYFTAVGQIISTGLGGAVEGYNAPSYASSMFGITHRFTGTSTGTISVSANASPWYFNYGPIYQTPEGNVSEYVPYFSIRGDEAQFAPEEILLTMSDFDTGLLLRSYILKRCTVPVSGGVRAVYQPHVAGSSFTELQEGYPTTAAVVDFSTDYPELDDWFDLRGRTVVLKATALVATALPPSCDGDVLASYSGGLRKIGLPSPGVFFFGTRFCGSDTDALPVFPSFTGGTPPWFGWGAPSQNLLGSYSSYPPTTINFYVFGETDFYMIGRPDRWPSNVVVEVVDAQSSEVLWAVALSRYLVPIVAPNSAAYPLSTELGLWLTSPPTRAVTAGQLPEGIDLYDYLAGRQVFLTVRSIT